MNSIQRISAVNHNLLREVAQTDLSLETIFVLYGALVVVAVILWAIGVLAFGRRRSNEPVPSENAAAAPERITPAVP